MANMNYAYTAFTRIINYLNSISELGQSYLDIIDYRPDQVKYRFSGIGSGFLEKEENGLQRLLTEVWLPEIDLTEFKYRLDNEGPIVYLVLTDLIRENRKDEPDPQEYDIEFSVEQIEDTSDEVVRAYEVTVTFKLWIDEYRSFLRMIK